MLTLNKDQSLKVVLAVAVNTNQCPIVVEFEETIDNGGKNRAITSGTVTNSDTAVVALAGITEGRRIRGFSLYNADLATITVTITLLDNGTSRIIRSHTLLTLEMLNWNPETGWYATDASGNRKANSAAADSTNISAALSMGTRASSMASIGLNGSSQASSLASGIVIASLNSVSSQASAVAATNPATGSSIMSVLSVASFTNTTWSTVSSAVSRVKSSFTW